MLYIHTKWKKEEKKDHILVISFSVNWGNWMNKIKNKHMSKHY